VERDEKAEQARLWLWRGKVLQHAAKGSRNVARTFPPFGISRQAFDRWQRRYEAHGEAGLQQIQNFAHHPALDRPTDAAFVAALSVESEAP
jgi:hypothetical protein